MGRGFLVKRLALGATTMATMATIAALAVSGSGCVGDSPETASNDGGPLDSAIPNDSAIPDAGTAVDAGPITAKWDIAKWDDGLWE